MSPSSDKAAASTLISIAAAEGLSYFLCFVLIVVRVAIKAERTVTSNGGVMQQTLQYDEQTVRVSTTIVHNFGVLGRFSFSGINVALSNVNFTISLGENST